MAQPLRSLSESTSSPIRESQPRPTKPTRTKKGTISGGALLDTPPPGTQPPQLERSKRSRIPTERKRALLESQCKVPATTRSQNPASRQEHSSSVCPTRPKKLPKKQLVVHSPTTSDEEGSDAPAGKASNSRPQTGSSTIQFCTTGSGMAAGGQTQTSQVQTQPSAESNTQYIDKSTFARDLGRIIGRDLAGASTQFLQEALQAVSHQNPLPMGLEERYPEASIICSSPTLLSKGGGYYRKHDKDTSGLASSLKRGSPSMQTYPRKQARSEQAEEESQHIIPPLPSRFFPTSPPNNTTTHHIPTATQPADLRREILFGRTSPTELDMRATPVPCPLHLISARPSSLYIPYPPPNIWLSDPLLSDPKPSPALRKQTMQQLPRASPNTKSSTFAPARKTKLTSHKVLARTAVLSSSESEPELSGLFTARNMLHSRSSTRPTTANHSAGSPGPAAACHGAPKPADTPNSVSSMPQDTDKLDALIELVLQASRQHVRSSDGSGTAHSGQAESSTAAQIRAAIQSKLKTNQQPNRVDNVSTLPSSHANLLPPGDDITTVLKTVVAKKQTHTSHKGLKQYPHLHRVATAAILDMLASACVKGVYQCPDTYWKWAADGYRCCWKRLAKDIPYERPPQELLNTMIARVSWLRSTVKDRLELVVQQGYGFKVPECQADVLGNRKLFTKLYPNNFHCRDLVPETNQYENSNIKIGLGQAFYNGVDSLGVQFQERFSPMPLPAMAFVLTMMQSCIEDWRTGYYKPVDLRFSHQQPVFDAHLHGLYVYESGAEARTYKYQNDWSTFGMKKAGVHAQQTLGHHCQPTTCANKVRPDTPVPDAESETEYHDNGRLTAGAKGKHRYMGDNTDTEPESD